MAILLVQKNTNSSLIQLDCTLEVFLKIDLWK